ncbi:MAG: hypothetical protein WC523_04010 [Patescibacteria group bacterium]
MNNAGFSAFLVYTIFLRWKSTLKKDGGNLYIRYGDNPDSNYYAASRADIWNFLHKYTLKEFDIAKDKYV